MEWKESASWFRSMKTPGAIGPTDGRTAWSFHLDPLAEVGVSLFELYSFGYALVAPGLADPVTFIVTPEPGVLWGDTGAGLRPSLFCAEKEVLGGGDTTWLALGDDLVVLLTRPDMNGIAFCLVSGEQTDRELLMARARAFLEQDARSYFQAERRRRQIFSPGASDSEPLFSALSLETLFAHLRPPQGACPFRWSASRFEEPEDFDLNQLFPLVQAWVHVDPRVATDLVMAALSFQLEDGKVPAVGYPALPPQDAPAVWPLLAQSAELVARDSPSPDFLEFVLPRLTRYLNWACGHYLPDPEGPAHWAHSSEALLPETFDKRLASADLNALLLCEMDACARLARHWPLEREPAWYRYRPRLQQALASWFWDENRRCYPDRYLGGQAIERVTLSAVLPLLWPELSSTRRAALIDWFSRKEGFGRDEGFPAWIPWEGDAEPPPVRPLHQALVLAALWRAGARPEFRAGRERALSLAAFGWEDRGTAEVSTSASGYLNYDAATAALAIGLLEPSRPSLAPKSAGSLPLIQWMDRYRVWLLGGPVGVAVLLLLGITVGLSLKTRPHRMSLITLSNLAQCLYREGHYEEARLLYEEVLSTGKDFPAAEFFLGNALVKKGLVQEAEQRYRRLLSYPDLHPVALLNLGVSLHMQGKSEEALHCFEEYVALYNTHSNNLLARARLAVQLLTQAVPTADSSRVMGRDE